MPPRSKKESSVDDELNEPAPVLSVPPAPRTALQSDRERFERALRAARAANDAERAAALAEASPSVAAEEAAVEAAAVQPTPPVVEEPSPREVKAEQRRQRREARRQAKDERAAARAEAKQQRSPEPTPTATPATEVAEAATDDETSDDEQTALIAAMPEHTEVVAEPEVAVETTDAETSDDEQTMLIAAMPEHTEVAGPEVVSEATDAEIGDDEQTALIAAMPEHTEVLPDLAAPAREPGHRAEQAPDDAIVEPPPALPSSPAKRSKGSTTSEKLGVVLVLLGALGLLCSVVLAVGALLAAIDVDVDASFAGAVSDLCDALVGPLGGLFSFSGENADARNDLFARGIGSMIYLAIGLFLPSVARRRDS